MEPVKEFFFGQSRIGNDSCGVTQEDVQNDLYNKYMTHNYYSDQCGMRNQIEFATNYKSMNFSAAGGMGNQCDIGGCNIDMNTNLWAVPTHTKARISLFQRPFLTVPYLGRGPGDPMAESHLQQPNIIPNRKSVNTTSEASYIPLSQYPLLPDIQKTISNPTYLVEGVADPSWVRGGISSREITKEYNKK
jgi:hypothetical protein